MIRKKVILALLLIFSCVSIQAQTIDKDQKPIEKIEDPDNLASEYFSQIMGVALSATSNLKLYQFVYDWIGTPYRLGGGTKKGIDCSGFTQMVYKLNGYQLLRDASQQASQGEVLSFIEESEPGDLAFFDNEEGHIIHVGIILENNYIIHASGKVRVDRLDHLGIYNAETNRHTHRLRVIKKII